MLRHRRIWSQREPSDIDESPDAEMHPQLCQNRDPIANLGNRHGGAIRYETDFNTHFDPLIFIVPVGLDGVDIDRELTRRGLYAYDRTSNVVMVPSRVRTKP